MELTGIVNALEVIVLLLLLLVYIIIKIARLVVYAVTALFV